MSNWLSKRLAMECNSEKAMQYKNFLATLDENKDKQIQTTNSDIVNIVTSAINAMIPTMVEQFTPMINENKQMLENNRKMLEENKNTIKEQKEVYEKDRKELIKLSTCKSANVKFLTEKLKFVLSRQLGQEITAVDGVYKEAKFRLFNYYDVAKWEDLCIDNIKDVCNTINNIQELFDGELKINDIYEKKEPVISKKKPIKTKNIDGQIYLKCNCCGEYKPMTKEYYYKDSRSSTGFKAKCKVCKSNYYKNNKKQRLSYQNKYAHENLGVFPRSQYSFNKGLTN